MKRRKILTFILGVALLLSVSLNLYFLMPTKASESISSGYYVSTDVNGMFYKLSIMQDNKVLLYGTKNDLLFTGELAFVEKEKCYLIETGSDTYQVAARNDVVFLPIVENGRIVSKLFKKISSSSVTFA